MPLRCRLKSWRQGVGGDFAEESVRIYSIEKIGFDATVSPAVNKHTYIEHRDPASRLERLSGIFQAYSGSLPWKKRRIEGALVTTVFLAKSRINVGQRLIPDSVFEHTKIFRQGRLFAGARPLCRRPTTPSTPLRERQCDERTDCTG